ncbi:MAG TPA: DUF1080 domain-containing protein [Vicinamibacteria bacterium]|nr:DUF1080 domain-containing protein [Vicinamibacteria bacterium]
MLTVSLILAGALAAPAPAKVPTADDYVGRWNVKITDATDTFASGGFQIEKKGSALGAGVVWRWGSYLEVKSAEVKDGTLVLVREEEPGKRDTFEARLEGGRLEGKVTYPDGKVHHFEGKKAPLLASKTPPVWGEPVTLFDGKTLAGWKLRDPKRKNGWAVVNGELAVVDPKDNSDLVSERAFQDMKLHVEFNAPLHSNSGVYLRGRYEVQIETEDPASTHDTQKCGAIYSRIAPRVNAAKPAGEWQTYDVTFVGREVTVVFNGTTIVQGTVEGVTGGALSPFEDEPGPLMLQGDHGKVRFRNVVVTPAK